MKKINSLAIVIILIVGLVGFSGCKAWYLEERDGAEKDEIRAQKLVDDLIADSKESAEEEAEESSESVAEWKVSINGEPAVVCSGPNRCSVDGPSADWPQVSL